MKKFKKALALSLTLAMGLSMVACGDKKDSTTAASGDTTAKTEAGTQAPATETKTEAGSTAAATEAPTEAPAATGIAKPDVSGWDDSKKIYAYSWDDDFQKKLNVVLEANPELQPYVEYVNLGVASEESLELIDAAFKSDKYPSLIPADIGSAKYWTEDDSKTLDLKSIGFTDDMFANTYQYAKDFANYNGEIKAVTWQSTAGSVFYNRAIAKEVFGTDEPADIQAKFADWDKFFESAGELDKAGYDVISSTADTFRVYQNNAKLPWVNGTQIQVDDNLKKWVEDSKKLADAGYCNTWGQWGEDWNKGFYPEGKVFAYFGPAWLIDFCMAADVEGSVAHDGGWAATEGPQGFYWGGTWICAATGTDNANLVADIMRKMTMDPAVMKDIVLKDNDFVNNRPVMEELANDPSYQNAVLGGQNPLKMFCAGADNIDMANLTAYDQGLLGDFQTAMGDYINGNYATYDEALEQFYTLALQRYPELTR